VKGIVAKYPKDVRLVMRYLPLHPGSAEAIVILEAARVQGKLEPVTAALLEAQPEWHDGKMDGAWAAAEKAGLNVAKARAMPTTDAMAWMEQDIADARAVGVRGTPTFFVNGEMLVQPSPEQVEARVQAAVAAKGK
jgi:protein-disulfide isomerase